MQHAAATHTAEAARKVQPSDLLLRRVRLAHGGGRFRQHRESVCQTSQNGSRHKLVHHIRCGNHGRSGQPRLTRISGNAACAHRHHSGCDRASSTRRALPITLAGIAPLSPLTAWASGADFVGSQSNGASLSMAMAIAIAALSYTTILFTSPAITQSQPPTPKAERPADIAGSSALTPMIVNWGLSPGRQCPGGNPVRRYGRASRST